MESVDHDFVDGEAVILAGVLLNKDPHFIGELIRGHVNFIAAIKIEEISPGPDLAHQGIEL